MKNKNTILKNRIKLILLFILFLIILSMFFVSFSYRIINGIVVLADTLPESTSDDNLLGTKSSSEGSKELKSFFDFDLEIVLTLGLITGIVFYCIDNTKNVLFVFAFSFFIELFVLSFF